MRTRRSVEPEGPIGDRPYFHVEDIETIVYDFYGKVQQDPMLAPVFATRIEDWGPHLERMVNFWRAVLRSEGTYSQSPKGPPPVIHWNLEGPTHEHYDRWLELFAETVANILPPDDARWIVWRACRMADALSSHLMPRV